MQQTEVRNMHFVSETTKEEKCNMCKEQATHKVGEEIAMDESKFSWRHNFTAYVCCKCFKSIFGGAVFCRVP